MKTTYMIQGFYVMYGGPYGKIEWYNKAVNLQLSFAIDTLADLTKFPKSKIGINEIIRTVPDSMGSYFLYRIIEDYSVASFISRLSDAEALKLIDFAHCWLGNETCETPKLRDELFEDVLYRVLRFEGRL